MGDKSKGGRKPYHESGKMSRLNCSFPVEIMDWLRRRAEAYGASMADVVRDIVSYHHDGTHDRDD